MCNVNPSPTTLLQLSNERPTPYRGRQNDRPTHTRALILILIILTWTRYSHIQLQPGRHSLAHRPHVERTCPASLFLVLLIRNGPGRGHGSRVVERVVGEAPLVRWLKDLERTHQTIVHRHHRTCNKRRGGGALSTAAPRQSTPIRGYSPALSNSPQ